MSPYTPRTSPLDNKHLADNIDIKKITSKGFFHEGSSFTKPKAKGLQGQLGKMRREHKFGTAKNLSRHNLKDISDMIAKEMKNAHPYSKAGLTRKMGKRIMATAWKKVKTDPTFSRSDRRDLKVVVKAIKEKSREAVLKKPDSSTKSIGAEKIEATKNPASRLQNQTINKDNNLKISSDSLLNSILVKPLDNKKPLDRQETLMKLRRTGSTIESPESIKTNNIQAPTNKPLTPTPEKNNNIETSTDPFLNSLLAKAGDTNTSISKSKTLTTSKPSESPKIINSQTPLDQSANITSVEDIENGILVKNLQNSTVNDPLITKPITNEPLTPAKNINHGTTLNNLRDSIRNESLKQEPTKTNDVVTLKDDHQSTKSKTSTTSNPSEPPKIINNQTPLDQSANITSVKDIENGILVKNLQNSTISEPVTTIPKIPTSKSSEPIETSGVITPENNQQNIKSETLTNTKPLTETKTTNNNASANQPINTDSVKDIENGILVTSLKNSATNKPAEIKPEPIDANDTTSPEDNNESVEPKAKAVINKPNKPTEDKTIQTPTENSKSQTTTKSSNTKSETTSNEASEPAEKSSAEVAKEEALRKKRNIASAGALTRMLNEEAKKNNPNNQKTSSDPENSTGDKSAKPTTEPIISGSTKPRKDSADQPITEQFLDVDSIDYLTELAQKLGEPQQNTQPIIPQKQAGISEVAEKAEDMNI